MATFKSFRSLFGLTILCVHANARAQAELPEGYSPVDDMQVVDCLFPPQVRVVGGRTYMTPRRPGRATAAECREAGGEYTAYDRATRESSLAVWLGQAEQGDPEAQTIVGEIYERGVGSDPDYAAAAEWYRRAADQGFSRAQFNLGALYEQGLGVPEDRLQALNYYRVASGLDEDSLIYQSAAYDQIAALRSELEARIRERDSQISVISRQLEALQRELEEERRDSAEIEAEIDVLRSLQEQLMATVDAQREEMDRLPRFERPPSLGAFADAEDGRYRQRDFGNYFALMLGVQNYDDDQIDDLTSPLEDMSRARAVLEETYGFADVITLADPTQAELMSAVNQLNEDMSADDNLLIYFVGHGARLRSGLAETGYWLPTDALPAPNDTYWVANDFITRHLSRIAAQRILVISDAPYSGMLGEEPGFVMVGEGSYSDEYIEWKKPKRARLVLASGSDGPIDAPDEQPNSVFATALLSELEGNEQVLTAPELFLRVRNRLRAVAELAGGGIEPSLKVIKDAGHEVGDFFFVPVAR